MTESFVHFQCQGCGKRMRVRAESAGKKVRCPCGQIVIAGSKDGRQVSSKAQKTSTPQPAPATSIAAPTQCYYCGVAEATDHVIAVIEAISKEAREFAKEDRNREGSKISDQGGIIPKYTQSVNVPRCNDCRRSHRGPWLAAFVVGIVSTLTVIILSLVGLWVSFRDVAGAMAETKVEVGDFQMKYSWYGILMTTFVIYLAPAFVLAAISFWIVGRIKRRLANRRGIRWKNQVDDYPVVNGWIEQGWQFYLTV